MISSKRERRRYPRTRTSLPLKIYKKGLDIITETRNISCSGLYCRVNKLLPPMCKVGVTAVLPIQRTTKLKTEKIRCTGVVVRSEPVIIKGADSAYQNIAVFFTDLSEKDKEKVAEYVFQSRGRER